MTEELSSEAQYCRSRLECLALVRSRSLAVAVIIVIFDHVALITATDVLSSPMAITMGRSSHMMVSWQARQEASFLTDSPVACCHGYWVDARGSGERKSKAISRVDSETVSLESMAGSIEIIFCSSGTRHVVKG